jgi:predicted nuclease with TOPRIM domain
MATAKLRKENQQLREEIEELQGNLKQITADLSKKNESLIEQDGRHASPPTTSTDKDKSLEFIRAQNDDLILFKNNTMKELKHYRSTS